METRAIDMLWAGSFRFFCWVFFFLDVLYVNGLAACVKREAGRRLGGYDSVADDPLRPAAV